MSYAEDLMAELKKDTPAVEQEQPQETETNPGDTEDTPKEETAPEAPETKPEEPPRETPEDKPEDKPEEPPKEKPDLSQLTKEQKAEHAFKRQLAKQASKYENIISDMNGKFDKVTAELEELKKSKAESEKKPLTRDQFEYDDDFVKALVKQGMDEEMARMKAQQEAEKAESDKKAAEEREIMEAQQRTAQAFNENCKAAFGEEEYAQFEKTLRKAADNGLAEILDNAPAVREYLFEQPDGPIVLREMLNNRESFVRVMSTAKNPMSVYLTMHDLAKEVMARKPEETSQEQPKPKSTMPSLGKPGASRSAASAGDMWSSDDELIGFVRKHK